MIAGTLDNQLGLAQSFVASRETQSETGLPAPDNHGARRISLVLLDRPAVHQHRIDGVEPGDNHEGFEGADESPLLFFGRVQHEGGRARLQYGTPAVVEVHGHAAPGGPSREMVAVYRQLVAGPPLILHETRVGLAEIGQLRHGFALPAPLGHVHGALQAVGMPAGGAAHGDVLVHPGRQAGKPARRPAIAHPCVHLLRFRDDRVRIAFLERDGAHIDGMRSARIRPTNRRN